MTCILDTINNLMYICTLILYMTTFRCSVYHTVYGHYYRWSSVPHVHVYNFIDLHNNIIIHVIPVLLIFST